MMTNESVFAEERRKTAAARARSVLVVDDDRATRAVLGEVLIAGGWKPEMAANGAEAREVLLSPDSPRVVLLDWLLPDVPGTALCREILYAPHSRPHLILVTIKGETEDLVEGLDAGADDFIAKPFKPAEVCARVRAGFRTIDLREELKSRVMQLEAAMRRVTQLESLLPICMFCRRIRDGEVWQSLEGYLQQHADVRFSHGCCPVCLAAGRMDGPEPDRR